MIVTSVLGGAGVELGAGDGLGTGVAVGVATGEGLAAAMLAGASVGAALAVGEAEPEQAAAANITRATPARLRTRIIGHIPQLGTELRERAYAAARARGRRFL